YPPPAANMLSASDGRLFGKERHLEKRTSHATGRPAVPDHSGASAHKEAFDGGRDRGRTGDFEANHLPRYNDPDRTAGADPRRSRCGLHPGKGIRPAAVDAHA